jgi:vancomycin resistance protein YoaR
MRGAVMNGRYYPDAQYQRRGWRINRSRLVLMISLISFCVIGVICLQRTIALNSTANVFPAGISIETVELRGMTVERARTALEWRRQEVLHSTVELSWGGYVWEFSPAMIGGEIDIDNPLVEAWRHGHTGNWFQRYDQIVSLRKNPRSLSLELKYDTQALDDYLETIRRVIDIDPVESGPIFTSTETGNYGIDFTESAAGYKLNVDQLKSGLVSSIENGSFQDMALEPEVLKPISAKEELKKNVILRCDYYTRNLSDPSSNRSKNVARALYMYNRKVVQPGEEVSFFDTVGPRTKENGFYLAPEYSMNELKEGIGGGVCQASTTVYGAAVLSGLAIIERHPHSMTVDYVAMSTDAAVVTGTKDLKFINNTGKPIYIIAYVSNRQAHVAIYGEPMEYRLQFRYEQLTVLLPDDKRGIIYEDDVKGKFVYSKKDKVLKELGREGGWSKSYLQYIDIQTNELIKEEPLNHDYYSPGLSTYWRGIH